MDRSAAVDRIEEIVETVESETMPVPVREIWVYGDVALGLDPVERLDVYVTKDILLGGGGGSGAGTGDGDDVDYESKYGVKGIGGTVRADWAEQHTDLIRANDGGYAAPEQCLAAHLLPDDEPIHLEVCNASFDDNVTQRLEGALARDTYEEILDPRGVCLWVDGERDPEAFEKLREGSFAMPTLDGALEMLGADAETATTAAETIEQQRAETEGATVRGDVV
ncbi:DUF7095 family protein [Haloparvum sp. AD34]